MAEYKIDTKSVGIDLSFESCCVGIELSSVLIGRRDELFFFDIKSGDFKRELKVEDIDCIQSATGCRGGIVLRLAGFLV